MDFPVYQYGCTFQPICTTQVPELELLASV